MENDLEPTVKITNWNDNIESILKKQQARCASFKFLHNKEAKRLSFLNKVFSIASILLVSLTATGSTVTNDPAFNAYPWTFPVNISYSILLYTSAVISSIQSYYSFDKKSEKNTLVSLRYTALFYSIKRMLSLDRPSRYEPEKYFNWVNREFEDILLKAPEISREVKKRYENKFSEIEFGEIDIENAVDFEYNETDDVKYELERFMKHNA